MSCSEKDSSKGSKYCYSTCTSPYVRNRKPCKDWAYTMWSHEQFGSVDRGSGAHARGKGCDGEPPGHSVAGCRQQGEINRLMPVLLLMASPIPSFRLCWYIGHGQIYTIKLVLGTSSTASAVVVRTVGGDVQPVLVATSHHLYKDP